MNTEEKVYHIYAKGKCIYHSLSESKFSDVWETLHRMVELLDLNISKEDLQYEQVYLNKLVMQNSSY